MGGGVRERGARAGELKSRREESMKLTNALVKIYAEE